MNSRGTNSEGVRARCRRKGLTFQVLRRTSGTGMQKHGDLKATHGMLRHAYTYFNPNGQSDDRRWARSAPERLLLPGSGADA